MLSTIFYNALTDDSFDIADIDAEKAARDSIFSIEDFMTDLANLYNAARFYIALGAICFANNEPVYAMYQTGRRFLGLPYFVRYKRNMDIPNIDLSAANGDLLEEMKLGNKHLTERPPEQPPEGEFYTECQASVILRPLGLPKSAEREESA